MRGSLDGVGDDGAPARGVGARAPQRRVRHDAPLDLVQGHADPEVHDGVHHGRLQLLSLGEVRSPTRKAFVPPAVARVDDEAADAESRAAPRALVDDLHAKSVDLAVDAEVPARGGAELGGDHPRDLVEILAGREVAAPVARGEREGEEIAGLDLLEGLAHHRLAVGLCRGDSRAGETRQATRGGGGAGHQAPAIARP